MRFVPRALERFTYTAGALALACNTLTGVNDLEVVGNGQGQSLDAGRTPVASGGTGSNPERPTETVVGALMDEPAPKALGETCDTADSCASGNCAKDSSDVRRCCDAACDGPCQRCAIDGRCSATAVSDDACAAVACPAGDACRDFEDFPAGSCVAAACASTAQCASTWKPAAREGAACTCNEAGCGLNLAEPCTRAADCDSTFCYPTASGASLCCSAACGSNQICRSDGQGCELAPACTNGSFRCFDSTYQRCANQQWVTQTECGALGCDLSKGGCLQGAGASCTNDGDCGIGACRASAAGGSVCCTASCNGPCQRCAASGTECVSLADDAACGNIACPPDETCRDYPASISQNRCVGGRCGTAGQLCAGAPRNAGQVCSANTLCDAAGNCNAPRRGLGQACTAAGQCASGFCVDGVCCNEGCGGLCETCATTGTCRAAADDGACASVRCSEFSAQCVSTAADITSARCRSRGVCKTEADCGFLSDTTACSDCSGCIDPVTSIPRGRCSQGECARVLGPPVTPTPQVDCGIAGLCALSAGVACCLSTSDQECPFSSCAGIPGAVRATCDSASDCASGQICCTDGSTQASCRAPGDCNGTNLFEVCGTATTSSACTTQLSCRPIQQVLPNSPLSFFSWSVCVLALR